MFAKQLEWKAKMFPVRVADIDHELRKEKLVFRGVDREGRPVIYIRSKNFDPKGTEVCVCVLGMGYGSGMV